jgi:hypothetical protein
MTEEQNDQIEEAAQAFKAAIEKMGGKDVVILWVLTDEATDRDVVGGVPALYRARLGACEFIKDTLVTGTIIDHCSDCADDESPHLNF